MTSHAAKGILSNFKAAFNDFMEDKALRLAAALAYYSIFSIAPLLVIAIGVAGLVLGQEAAQGQLQQELAKQTGPQAAQAVQSMVQSASKPTHGWLATTIGFVVLLFGASGVLGQLKDALNTVWEVKPKAQGGIMGFIRERLLSFGMILVIGFLLLTSLLLTTAVTGLGQYLETLVPIPAAVWAVLTFVLSFAVVTTLFAMIFKVLPDAEVEWRDVWVGAAVTALLFEIGKFGLGYYLGKQGAESAYGAATAVVLLLLWVYYTSCIMFLGAEFTQVYARERGRVIEPAANAERVTPEERVREGVTPSKRQFTTAGAAEPKQDQPPREVLPVPERPLPGVIGSRPTPEPEENPLTALLAVTGASLLVGLLSRGWVEKTRKPSTRFKEGLRGLTRDAGHAVASALDRAGKGLQRKVSEVKVKT